MSWSPMFRRENLSSTLVSPQHSLFEVPAVNNPPFSGLDLVELEDDYIAASGPTAARALWDSIYSTINTAKVIDQLCGDVGKLLFSLKSLSALGHVDTPALKR